MNEAKLNELVELYIKNYSSISNRLADGNKKKEYFQSFDYEKIINMSRVNLIDYLRELWTVFPMIANKIIDENGFDNFKNKLADLLYGDRELSERYNEFYNNIRYFREYAMSEVLSYIYPNDFMLWDSKVRHAFNILEIEIHEATNFDNYNKILSYGKIIQSKINNKLNANLDLVDVDCFYEFLSKNKTMDYKLLDTIIIGYKKKFSNYRKDELYKWKAIQCFQDNWDIDAIDFASMLEKSLNDSNNLLNSFNYFPQKMIIAFAKKEPNVVRKMFKNLFNENIPLIDRYKEFVRISEELLNRYWDVDKNHYQDKHAISTYLSFMYPNKYYVYKATVARKFASYLKVDISCKEMNLIKEEKQANELCKYFDLCDDVLNYILNDKELLELSSNNLPDGCYLDEMYHTLAWDIIYFGGTIFFDKKYWLLSPNPENIPSWTEFKDKGIIKIGWSKLGDLTDINTKTEINNLLNQFYPGSGSRKNDTHALYQFVNDINIGDIIIVKNGSHSLYGYGEVKSDYTYDDLHHVREVSWIKTGNWDVSDIVENNLVLKTLTDITSYGNYPHELIKRMNENMNYYFLNANPSIWSFSSIKVGEIIEYTSRGESGHKRRVYNNYENAKAGDIVIAYESTPKKAITGICKIVSKDDNNNIKFEKIETLVNPIEYEEFKDFEELQNMEFIRSPQGSLFKLTQEEYDVLKELINIKNPPVSTNWPDYSEKQFLEKVYMEKPIYLELVGLLKKKKNIILQGAPGVGKTFMAKRLAYSIMKKKDDSRIMFVQFHQSYSYEDFIEGYKPKDDIFKLEKGSFYLFCKEAEKHPDKEFFCIIDEINRGNLSKIFGELLMLIEEDKREVEKVRLAYSREEFTVPKNIYIIGMMNTADRSLAFLDFALRRRFSFFKVSPAFNNKKFIQYQNKFNSDYLNKIINKIKILNKEINQDSSLGEGFEIGHSYFCDLETASKEKIKQIIKYDIIPMLEEYWFDNKKQITKWKKEFGVDNDKDN